VEEAESDKKRNNAPSRGRKGYANDGTDPFLQALEPPRIVPVEIDTHATEPNTTKEAPPERIITQDDPSSLQTQVEQPTIARMPQRSSRTPARIGIPQYLSI
jgi:hypothetical protein